MASKETSSSSGVLFAKATKTWDLPQRARPGRKPKIALTATITSPSPHAESAPSPPCHVTAPSTSNRDAQKNFRLRQREHLASLESRIAAYERNEVQSNIALQQTARAMKEENERLKLQVAEMAEGKLVVEKELEKEIKDKALMEVQMKKLKSRLASLLKESRARQSASSMGGSTDKAGHSPGTGSNYSGLSPAEIIMSMANNTPSTNQVYSNTSHHSSNHTSHASTPPQQPLSHNSDALINQHVHPDNGPSATAAQLAEELACGFCQGQASICMCKMVAEQAEEEKLASLRLEAPPQSMTQPTYAQYATGQALDLGSSGIWRSNGPVSTANFGSSNADDLSALAPSSTITLAYVPPVEQAVPLRRAKRQRRDAERSNVMFGFVSSTLGGMQATTSNQNESAECTGDPRNCPACKDDAFGKEFCETLSRSDPQYVNMQTNQRLRQTVPSGCSGDPANCSACRDDSFGREFCETLTKVIPDDETSITLPPLLPNALASGSNITLPPITTPDLEFDAIFDTTCCGNAELCGATHETCSEVPEAVAVVMPPKPSPYATSTERQTIRADEAWRTLKAHPNAKFASLQLLAEVVAKGTTWLQSTLPEADRVGGGQEDADIPTPGGTMQLVPIETLVASGRKRKLEIHPEAVQEALAMLDAVPGHSIKRRRLSDIRDAY